MYVFHSDKFMCFNDMKQRSPDRCLTTFKAPQFPAQEANVINKHSRESHDPATRSVQIAAHRCRHPRTMDRSCSRQRPCPHYLLGPNNSIFPSQLDRSSTTTDIETRIET
ncbi:hypothetical protein KC19_VG262000 [Ceratodon purpureus]|uniref:Uncharacterized protein n=1 Tax=Ceratodon purpureus TaxID=3225 RepID=A0A8T0HUB6_CERPU|nr:hypothetical protein KC19_VG262000 [Ceratodon purpureus]